MEQEARLLRDRHAKTVAERGARSPGEIGWHLTYRAAGICRLIYQKQRHVGAALATSCGLGESLRRSPGLVGCPQGYPQAEHKMLWIFEHLDTTSSVFFLDPPRSPGNTEGLETGTSLPENKKAATLFSTYWGVFIEEMSQMQGYLSPKTGWKWGGKKFNAGKAGPSD